MPRQQNAHVSLQTTPQNVGNLRVPPEVRYSENFIQPTARRLVPVGHLAKRPIAQYHYWDPVATIPQVISPPPQPSTVIYVDAQPQAQPSVSSKARLRKRQGRGNSPPCPIPKPVAPPAPPSVAGSHHSVSDATPSESLHLTVKLGTDILSIDSVTSEDSQGIATGSGSSSVSSSLGHARPPLGPTHRVNQPTTTRLTHVEAISKESSTLSPFTQSSDQTTSWTGLQRCRLRIFTTREGPASVVQFANLMFYNTLGEAVVPEDIIVRCSTGISPPGYDPQDVVCPWAAEGLLRQVTPPEPLEVQVFFAVAKPIISYSWCTAGEPSSYDPMGWSFDGFDGQNWWTLHAVHSLPNTVPTERHAQVGPFQLRNPSLPWTPPNDVNGAAGAGTQTTPGTVTLYPDNIGDFQYSPVSSALLFELLDAGLADDLHGRVKELLQKAADPNYQASDGNTPFLCACRLGDPVLVRLLVDYRAHVRTLDPEHNNGLHLLAALGTEESATAGAILLRQGLDPNMENVHGITPLMVAADALSTPFAGLLLSAGALRDHCNSHGQNAARVLERRILLNKEVSPNAWHLRHILGSVLSL